MKLKIYPLLCLSIAIAASSAVLSASSVDTSGARQIIKNQANAVNLIAQIAELVDIAQLIIFYRQTSQTVLSTGSVPKKTTVGARP